jgi:MazG family protein
MTESPADLFTRLLEVMTRLRSEGGCPWDREQTRESLKPYLIEEAYEVLEAIEGGDVTALQEELGDLLFQVIFHAQIAHERREFAIVDVLYKLLDKMVHRHPHVFGDASVSSARDALHQWEAIKQREAEQAGRQRSVLAGVPRALPALLRAQRLQSKASRVRFDWPDAIAAWGKVREEVDETTAALASGDRDRIGEELGDVLFSVVNVARLAGLDAEDVLRKATDKFHRRFKDMEADLTARGKSVGTVTPDELERSWHAAKAQEQQS